MVRGRLLDKIHRLRKQVHALSHELHSQSQRLHTLEMRTHELGEEVRKDFRVLGVQISLLLLRVNKLQVEISSGMPNNKGLQAYFGARAGTSVTVTTAAGSLTGTVTAVGTNAVELTESSGDILVIPYSKIQSVQTN